jgi:antitoxin component YwqK of YwqJK toxin-antitoxin module
MVAPTSTSVHQHATSSPSVVAASVDRRDDVNMSSPFAFPKMIVAHFCIGIATTLTGGAGASGTTERECTHAGKKVDYEDRDVRVFIEGEVHCRRQIMDKPVTERFVMSRGRVLEEEFKSQDRHTLCRFKVINRQSQLHGEQLEYKPGSKTVIKREQYVDGRQLGRSERFHASGKLKELQLYVRDGEDANSSVRVGSSAGYRENGDLTYLRCSKRREENFDAKLCGFDGASKLEFKSDEGKVVRRATYLKGESIESETAAKQHSNWASLINTGVVREPKAATQKSEKQPNGHERTIELYANGQVKRQMEVDDRGQLVGRDEEFFESGQKARETEYVMVRDLTLVKDSTCWWQNGQRKLSIVVNTTSLEMQQRVWWDNGKEQYSGRFTIDSSPRSRREVSLESLIQCEGRVWGARAIGKHISFRRDGSKETETHYNNEGEREGAHRMFNERGALELEMTYKAGKIARQKTWKDGVLQKDEEYYEDGSIKSSR